MVRHSAPLANSFPSPAPMPAPDAMIGRDVVIIRSERLPELLDGYPPYAEWDCYEDPETPGVLLLAKPKPARA